ncbi:nitrate ABC transporter ATP-binding protein [Paenibacillus ferrarius]|uniref:Nitrate ABC transporter ATP-binding protein n=1 Tax=Paenibacillus ferrarius TaxID=1469647 RepID=A0A1V4HK61_9BACL|nr:ABC transporter ATP-binding protein [Paenibacillus ferrarius]OPH57537.1 nitrate ABC transporter ATP-binding protein [Paenibacillus ferrarius]
MNKLELKSIHQTFTGKKQRTSVLSDISLHVKEGEFVSVIGPSGSGKSTLFHIIGGLIAPSSGEVWLDGRNVTGRKGLISYMPQQPALFPWRNIESNVALAQEVAGESRDAALEKAREWLPKVGLSGYEREYPHVLSGGMQQRVSFLRALLGPQEVMCLDEPFGSLDALTRQEMQAWLLNIWEQNKRSILFVTHSIEEALFLSDRIYVLSNKPARILEELVVPFARPRQEDVLLKAEFHELRQHIQSRLRQELSHE